MQQPRITIEMTEDGMGVKIGPVMAPPLMYGMLEMAHDALQEFYAKQREGSGIVPASASALPPNPPVSRGRKGR